MAEKRKNGRVKGSSYELKVSKLLSAWWGHPFHRTPGSGSWSSTHNSDMQGGDIIAPIEANFPFVVECKNQEEWTADSILFNSGKYPKFWQQVIGDAIRVNKVPMLIAHRNRSRNYLTIPSNSFIEMGLTNAKIPHAVSYISFTDELTEEIQEYAILTCELEAFMELVTPTYLKENIHSLYPEWIKEMK